MLQSNKKYIYAIRQPESHVLVIHIYSLINTQSFVAFELFNHLRYIQVLLYKKKEEI